MPRPIPAALGLALALASTAAFAGAQEDARAQNAVRVLTDIQAIPESAIPDKLFDEARAVVVIPDTVKVGLVLGGRRGHGLLSVKSPDGTWSRSGGSSRARVRWPGDARPPGELIDDAQATTSRRPRSRR